MFLLYLRFTIPLLLLAYLIKKNPFYSTYPIMLPFMIASFLISKNINKSNELSIVFYRMVKYSRRTNRMIHQILLDPTGTEMTFIYKN